MATQVVAEVVVPPLGKSLEPRPSPLPLAAAGQERQEAAAAAEAAVVPLSTRHRRPLAQLRTEIQR
jgi:hypothetical protein